MEYTDKMTWIQTSWNSMWFTVKMQWLSICIAKTLNQKHIWLKYSQVQFSGLSKEYILLQTGFFCDPSPSACILMFGINKQQTRIYIFKELTHVLFKSNINHLQPFKKASLYKNSEVRGREKPCYTYEHSSSPIQLTNQN